MQKKLYANCQIKLVPAVVTYADQEYGQINSRMTLEESISSVMDFYTHLTESSTAFRLYFRHCWCIRTGTTGTRS